LLLAALKAAAAPKPEMRRDESVSSKTSTSATPGGAVRWAVSRRRPHLRAERVSSAAR